MYKLFTYLHIVDIYMSDVHIKLYIEAPCIINQIDQVLTFTISVSSVFAAVEHRYYDILPYVIHARQGHFVTQPQCYLPIPTTLTAVF